MKWLRKLLPFAVGLAVVAGLVYAFLPRPVGVDVAAVTRGPLRVTVDEDGKTRVRERYVVSAPLAGRTRRVVLKAGDPVEAGVTPLTAVEPTDPQLLDERARAQARAQLKAAEAERQQAGARLEEMRAEYNKARNDLTRSRQLVEARSISVQEYDIAVQNELAAAARLRSAQAAVRVADFHVELAQAALLRTVPTAAYEAGLAVWGPLAHAVLQRNGLAPPYGGDAWRYDILSPVSGRVLRVYQESAAVVAAGAKLIEVGDPADLECEIDVLSADAVKVRDGAKVFLEHWGGDGPLLGRVRLVEPSGFTKVSALGVEEQRVNVIVDFADPFAKWQALKDGYRVEARIVVWEGEDVRKVPAGALFRHGGGWAVFAVADGRAALRPVQVGRNNGLEAEVLDGLAEGDRVIVHPSDKVKDGVAVAPR